MKNGIYSDISNSEYHSGPGISKSGLDLIARSPLHYYAAYLDPNRPEREETPAMALGTAIHAAVLEPEKFATDYLLMPKLDRRTKEGKAAYEDLATQAEMNNQTLISPDDYQACVSIANQVRQHPAARVLFESGAAEQSAYWTDEQTGVLCKARPDWLRPGAILDVKSTDDASPSGFQRSIVKWRYHVQAAWYADGIQQATGHPVGAFIFCVFEKNPPYAAAFYFADNDMIEVGRREYRRCLDLYAASVKSGNWQGYAPEIAPISLPQWVLNAANDNNQGV